MLFHIRIHASGDFFNPAYLRLWLRTAEANPTVKFWAFTKSINYLADHINNGGEIPPNLEIQTSRGSKHDHLIDTHGFKTAEVYHNIKDIPPHMPIDTDDWYAQNPGPSFALLENQTNRNQTNNPNITKHNHHTHQQQKHNTHHQNTTC